MKLVSFPCWASSGKCDSTDWEWDFEVSDEEYVRLKKAAEREDSFEECQEVEDIYSRLYSEMLSEQASVYLDDKSLLQEITGDLELADGAEPSEEQIIDYLIEYYVWGINFPKEFQN